MKRIWQTVTVIGLVLYAIVEVYRWTGASFDEAAPLYAVPAHLLVLGVGIRWALQDSDPS